jgi:hypothetical protein
MLAHRVCVDPLHLRVFQRRGKTNVANWNVSRHSARVDAARSLSLVATVDEENLLDVSVLRQ